MNSITMKMQADKLIRMALRITAFVETSSLVMSS